MSTVLTFIECWWHSCLEEHQVNVRSSHTFTSLICKEMVHAPVALLVSNNAAVWWPNRQPHKNRLTIEQGVGACSMCLPIHAAVAITKYYHTRSSKQYQQLTSQQTFLKCQLANHISRAEEPSENNAEITPPPETCTPP